MTCYFVTAVGTGIGKTFTTCALLHAARMRGAEALGYKPIISGWDTTQETDTAQIILAENKHRSVDSVSPWRFIAPLSPHMAAPKEGREIALAELVGWTHSIADLAPFTLIETVGGVMVPLNNADTTLDWMQAVGLPLILVTGSYLGSISHTLTALAAVRSRGLHVAALVMNESDAGTVPFAEAVEGLIPFIPDIPLRIFQPRVFSWQEAQEIHALASQL